MFQRLWNFAKRHRKKLIFGAVFTGGVYVAWRVWLPRLQKQLLQKLLQETEGLDELLELAAGAETGSQRKARFEHRQQVSDSYARRGLAELRVRHNPCFTVDACQNRLREALTREQKLEAFRDLQVECLAKAVSSLYVLHLHLLVHRVEFNIIGRELAAAQSRRASEVELSEDSTSKEAGVHAAFLESASYLQEHGVPRVAEAVRTAVLAVVERLELRPQTTMTAESMERFFVEACRDADSALLRESQAVATLLPESVERRVPAELIDKVKRLLDEARDCLESPQFLEVFTVVTAAAAKQLAGLLGDDAADPAAAPLANGQSAPLAKLFGFLIELSNKVLDADNGSGDFLDGFAEEPVVRQLCELLHFPNGDESSSGGV